MKPSHRNILIAVVLFLVIILFPEIASAQCAMCKATIEEQARDKSSDLAGGLNTGILYLMSFPYLIFGVIAYFWYKNSVKDSQKENFIKDIIRRRFKRKE
ncbi:MAG: hypothetical protein K2X86_12895 [Cytophagaceae bacterium]|nr:hypothetical protein [Cytophagaceae bacterium]